MVGLEACLVELGFFISGSESVSRCLSRSFGSVSGLFHPILSITQIDGKSSFINAFILS